MSEELVVVLLLVALAAGLYFWAAGEAERIEEQERDVWDDGGER